MHKVTTYKSGVVKQHRSRRRRKKIWKGRKKMVWKDVFLELTSTEVKLYKSDKRKKLHYALDLTTTPLQVHEQPNLKGGGAYGIAVRWGDHDDEHFEINCLSSDEQREWIRVLSANSRLASKGTGAQSPGERMASQWN